MNKTLVANPYVTGDTLLCGGIFEHAKSEKIFLQDFLDIRK